MCAYIAEGIGTALLLAAVVGSGIMGEQLAAGNVGIALLANSVATGGALVALIVTFGPISGAHFNPVVTVAEAFHGWVLWRVVPAYTIAQVIGAVVGVVIAHAMFNLPVIEVATNNRSGVPLMLGEAVATFGLLSVIAGGARQPQACPSRWPPTLRAPTGSPRRRRSRIRR